MLKMTGKKKAGLQRMPVLFICVCVLPTLILTLLFTVIPTLRALWMSLFDSTGNEFHIYRNRKLSVYVPG